MIYHFFFVFVALVNGINTQVTRLAIGLWFVFQLLNGIGALGAGSQAGGVAYAAHIGGFLAGLLFTRVFAIGTQGRTTR